MIQKSTVYRTLLLSFLVWLAACTESLYSMKGATKIAESLQTAHTITVSLTNKATSNKITFTIEITRSEKGTITILSLEPVSQHRLELCKQFETFLTENDPAVLQAFLLETHPVTSLNYILQKAMLEVLLQAEKVHNSSLAISADELYIDLFFYLSDRVGQWEKECPGTMKAILVKRFFEMNPTIAKTITNHRHNACDIECNELTKDKRNDMEACMELYFHVVEKFKSWFPDDEQPPTIVLERKTPIVAFIDLATTLCRIRGSDAWAERVLEASHEICKYAGFTLLDVACLCSHERKIGNWIPTYLTSRRQNPPDQLAEEINHRTDHGTPLIFAAQAGCKSAVKHLLRSGALTHLTTQEGDTALMKAAHCGHENTVACLLKYGALESINTENSKGITALYRALEANNVPIVSSLLTHKAGITFDSKLEPPLLLAIERTNPEMVQLLFNAGADPNSLYDDISMLSVAIMRYGRQKLEDSPQLAETEAARKVMQLFLDHPQINLTLTNQFGARALDTAQCYDLPEITQLLKTQSDTNDKN